MGSGSVLAVEPWWAQRQLGPCSHAYRIHEVMHDKVAGFTVATIPFLRFHACIVCGERGFIELPKQEAPRRSTSRCGDIFTTSNAPPGWAEEHARLLREQHAIYEGELYT